MFRLATIGMTLAFGVAGAAAAAVVPVPVMTVDHGIIQVGEGCGAGMWRAGDNICRPFRSPYGSNRGTRFECPPGWHIGPGGAKCWPNR